MKLYLYGIFFYQTQIEALSRWIDNEELEMDSDSYSEYTDKMLVSRKRGPMSEAYAKAVEKAAIRACFSITFGPDGAIWTYVYDPRAIWKRTPGNNGKHFLWVYQIGDKFYVLVGEMWLVSCEKRDRKTVRTLQWFYDNLPSATSVAEAEPSAEPSAELAAEDVAELVTEPAAELAAEPAAEQSAEQSVELTPAEQELGGRLYQIIFALLDGRAPPHLVEGLTSKFVGMAIDYFSLADVETLLADPIKLKKYLNEAIDAIIGTKYSLRCLKDDTSGFKLVTLRDALNYKLVEDEDGGFKIVPT